MFLLKIDNLRFTRASQRDKLDFELEGTGIEESILDCGYIHGLICTCINIYPLYICALVQQLTAAFTRSSIAASVTLMMIIAVFNEKRWYIKITRMLLFVYKEDNIRIR